MGFTLMGKCDFGLERKKIFFAIGLGTLYQHPLCKKKNAGPNRLDCTYEQTDLVLWWRKSLSISPTHPSLRTLKRLKVHCLSLSLSLPTSPSIPPSTSIPSSVPLFPSPSLSFLSLSLPPSPLSPSLSLSPPPSKKTRQVYRYPPYFAN